MALKSTPPISSSLHFPHLSVVRSPPYILFTRCKSIRSTYPAISLRKSCYFLFPVPLEVLSTGRSKRYTKSTEDSRQETPAGDNDDDDIEETYPSSDDFDKVTSSDSRKSISSLSDALNLGSRDPVYEVWFDFKRIHRFNLMQLTFNFLNMLTCITENLSIIQWDAHLIIFTWHTA